MECFGTEFKIIRSRRKTLAFQVIPGEGPVIRAPLRMSEKTIREAVYANRSWFENQLKKNDDFREKSSQTEKLTDEELKRLKEEARIWLAEKVRYYAEIIGVTYGKITVRTQKTLWGSCTVRGDMNFNCLIMLMPEKVRESIVVHELCHRKYMNHSEAFYKEVYRYFPDYTDCRRWLKENGTMIQYRAGKLS